MSKKAVLAVTGIAALLVCGGGGAIIYQTVDAGKDYLGSAVTPEQFEAQRIGQPEDEVRRALPKPLDVEEKDLYGTDTTREGRPADAACSYHPVSSLSEAEGGPMYRFCFTGGELTEKKKIMAEG
ncbi:hypothetical protein [Actinoplanes sp. M2I2]|uniref:hypothetical protein n=1 Tax=Actinoplanes sp. M2I2 TaxID=1734444 RepID=UPI002021FD3A|nr:hypothetical protein [Actinoplanes sp. M2I2]